MEGQQKCNAMDSPMDFAIFFFYQGAKTTNDKRQTTNNKRQRQTTNDTPHTTHNTHTHHTPHWGSCGPKPTSKMPVSRVYSATVTSQATVLSASSQTTRTHTHTCARTAQPTPRNPCATRTSPTTAPEQQQKALGSRSSLGN